MKYYILSSGSKGNCSLICSSSTSILIDCGINKKNLIAGLSKVNLGIEDISKAFLSHSHSDHISGFKFIPKEKWMVYKDMVKEELNEEQIFRHYEPVSVGDLLITPLPLSHDCPHTSGFLVKDVNSGEELVQITDTGYIKDKVLDLIRNKEYYIFESNHDVAMLYNSSRPLMLIRRIHSDKGHMDNVEASTYLSNLIGERTRQIVLAHLSEECNTPELALQTYNEVMKSQLGEIPLSINVRCAAFNTFLKGGEDD